MKWLAPFLLSITVLFGQTSIPHVRSNPDIGSLLSLNPSQSETIAAIAGKWYKTNSDGFLLWFDRESTATPDNTNIFWPYNRKGRWFTMSNTASGAPVFIGLEMPNGFTVTGSPILSEGTISVTTTTTNLVKASGNSWTNAIAGRDYVAPVHITNTGLTVGEGNILLGRTTIDTNNIEHIAIGRGLLLTNGLLSTGIYMDVQTYTDPGTYTWTNPPGSLFTYVVAIGGGAGGWGGETTALLDGGYVANTNGPFMNITYTNLPYYEFAELLPNPPAGMPFNLTSSIPTFNTNVGMLQEIYIEFSGALFGSVRHENTDTNGVSCTIDNHLFLYTKMSFDDPAATLIDFYAGRDYTNTVTSYDGVTDFGGTSGVNNFFGLVGGNTGAIDYILPSTDVTRFDSGTNVLAYVHGENASSYVFHGSTANVTQEGFTANDEVHVFYVYKPFKDVGQIVWYDVNTNGVVDVGEFGVPNAIVSLSYTNGDPVVGFPPTITDAGGFYSFNGVHPGDYKVTVTAGLFDIPVWDPGTGATSPDGIATFTMTIDTNEFGMNFGFVNTAPANPTYTVGDLVWYDVNGDGIKQANEPGMPNVTMWLETGGYIDFGPFPPVYVHGTLLQTTVTDNGGLYAFKNVVPGDYEVWVNTPPNPVFYVDSTQTFAAPGVKFFTISTENDFGEDFGYFSSVTDIASGKGGGGGGLSENTFVSSLLPSTVTVTVGAGGIGGQGVTTNGPSLIGTVGGDSSFGTNLVAYGGGYEPWCMFGCTNGSGYGTVNGGQNGEPTFLYSGFEPRGGRVNGKGAGGGGAGGRIYEYGGNAYSPNHVGGIWLNGGAPDTDGDSGDSGNGNIQTGQGGSGGGGVGVTRAGDGGSGGVPGGGGGGGGIGYGPVNGGLSGAGGNGGRGAVTVITFGIR